MVKIQTPNSFKSKVYQIVRGVPKGKVTTYGEIARMIHLRGEKFSHLGGGNLPRQVGWVLHQNRDSEVPCHRVVDRNGRLAPNFAFDGAVEQKRRLLLEKTKFRDRMHVDLAKSLWRVK